MPFDWREYLALARSVQTQTGTGFGEEAAKRCAVSRAYYAAFCWARNQAMTRYHFEPTGTANDHGQLRSHLRSYHRHREARLLDQLRQWRNQCDYDDNIPNLSQVVDAALKQADDVITSL